MPAEEWAPELPPDAGFPDPAPFMFSPLVRGHPETDHCPAAYYRTPWMQEVLRLRWATEKGALAEFLPRPMTPALREALIAYECEHQRWFAHHHPPPQEA